jgi:CHASE3 domain sensor protein
MTIRLRLLTGFLILIIIFLISFFVNQRLSTEVIRNSEYINRSETVIRNSNLIHKYMIDMQSGYRGYLLTSQEDFLSPFAEGLKSIPPLIAEQHQFTSSPEQNARLDSMMAIHAQWVQYAQSLISTKQDTLPEASAKYKRLFEEKVKTGTGKK